MRGLAVDPPENMRCGIMKLIHRKCGHPVVYDHIENKWFCFKCEIYPKPDNIVFSTESEGENESNN